MIKYALKCAAGHDFESWFGSSSDYDRLEKAGQLSCAVCGGTDVAKSVMAPRVAAARTAPGSEADQSAPETRPTLSAPASKMEAMIKEMREKVESSAENVGRNFAKEARAIHHGDAPERAIYGEARTDEARKLVEEGVPVLPLPWKAGRKT